MVMLYQSKIRVRRKDQTENVFKDSMEMVIFKG